MSHPLAVGNPVARPVAAHERVAALDPRRALQLALGALWLLDGMLQFQPSMFGHGFAQLLAGSAQGNPATVATYCAGRLAVTRRWQRPTELDTDAGHVLMGVAMAGMLVARLRILPAATWEAVFAAGAAWFAWQLVKSRRRTAAASGRCLHPAPHLVECVAMLYMFFAATPLTARAATPLTARAAAAGMAGLAPSRFSVLALLMALFMVGYVVRVADRLPLRTPALVAAPAPAGHVTTTARPYLAPRCAALCKIAMGLTMAYLLILML